MYLSGSEGYATVEASKESVELQLFTFPFFQLVLFLMPLFMDLNWRGFQSAFRRSEQLRRAKNTGVEMDGGISTMACAP